MPMAVTRRPKITSWSVCVSDCCLLYVCLLGVCVSARLSPCWADLSGQTRRTTYWPYNCCGSCNTDAWNTYKSCRRSCGIKQQLCNILGSCVQGVPHTPKKTLAGFGAISTTMQSSAVAFMRGQPTKDKEGEWSSTFSCRHTRERPQNKSKSLIKINSSNLRLDLTVSICSFL